VVDANWKSGAENFSGDDYHLGTLHRSAWSIGAFPVPFADNMMGYHIQASAGHSLSLSMAPTEDDPGPKFFAYPDDLARTFNTSRLNPEQLRIARRSRVFVGNVFPNFSILCVPMTDDGAHFPPTGVLTIRIWQPMGPGRVEAWNWFCAIRNMTPMQKERVYKSGLASFSMGGVFEMDDTEAIGVGGSAGPEAELQNGIAGRRNCEARRELARSRRGLLAALRRGRAAQSFSILFRNDARGTRRVAEVFRGLRGSIVGMLENQIAVIVGAGGGIGRAVVARYIREGALVLAVDREPGRLESLKKDLAHDRLHTLAADATTWETSERMVHEAVRRFGGLDVLVSCIGIYDHAIRLVDIPGPKLAAAFDECFRANVGSLLLNIRAAIPQLAARRGRVVVTGSFASYRTSGGGVLYTASKHAVVGLVSQLAFELAPKIRVNGVAPGVAQTVMSGLDALGQNPRDSILPGTEQQLPLAAMPAADAYGAIYALLGSAHESSTMTGSMVLADSGLLVRGLTAPNRGEDL